MSQKREDEIRQSVRDNYAEVADAGDRDECCGVGRGCCGVASDAQINAIDSSRLGYSENDRNAVPEGADLGLGCGNPRAIASLKSGEIVLDLGSGAGFDAFLAAREVGDRGKVIGVDMTPAMVSKARSNAEKGDYPNVDFRLGEIEYLPVADASVDIIISNCVINLSPDKPQVFKDAFRVLKPGGRLAISDVVASAELPEKIRSDLALRSACVAGAVTVDKLHAIIAAAGFIDIRIAPKDESREFIQDWAPGTNVENFVVSAIIEARKPGNTTPDG
ncbi:MAG: arsenite methyltransferase [Pseudomonadota bacterium]|nr:MAG: arsenite methyltransferase [Pseudomonadota bacterium]